MYQITLFHINRLAVCNLIAHETVSLLEALDDDGILAAQEMRDGLTLLAAAVDREDSIETHLAWIDREIENLRQTAGTTQCVTHLIPTQQLVRTIDLDAQIDAAIAFFRIAAQESAQETRAKLLELARTITDMCGMEDCLYVGAMHDSFPHALELSKQGYNAFALIYRPGAQTACEDLARAITFIFDHAEELEVDTSCYSLWGGSAGARMAAWLGTYGPAAFGGDDLPRPGAVIMQYTGLSEYSPDDPPTFACVGDSDGIAPWRTMRARLEAMSAQGIDTEFHCYHGLGHGFGLGTGTAAEGWLDLAVRFWERQM